MFFFTMFLKSTEYVLKFSICWGHAKKDKKIIIRNFSIEVYHGNLRERKNIWEATSPYFNLLKRIISNQGYLDYTHTEQILKMGIKFDLTNLILRNILNTMNEITTKGIFSIMESLNVSFARTKIKWTRFINFFFSRRMNRIILKSLE